MKNVNGVECPTCKGSGIAKTELGLDACRTCSVPCGCCGGSFKECECDFLEVDGPTGVPGETRCSVVCFVHGSEVA